MQPPATAPRAIIWFPVTTGRRLRLKLQGYPRGRAWAAAYPWPARSTPRFWSMTSCPFFLKVSARISAATSTSKAMRCRSAPRAAVFCMTAGSLPSLAVISVTGRGTRATPSGTREGSQWSLLPLKMIAPPASTSRACRSMPSWLRAMSTFRWSPWLSTFSSESRRRSQVWPPRISDW